MNSYKNITAILLTMVTISVMCTSAVLRGKKLNELMSPATLEHFYVIEENALSNADVLLREDYLGLAEGESLTEHEKHAVDLTDFMRVVQETKSVHRQAGPDLVSFLGHPINVYHMLRRLDHDWRKGLDILMVSKPCKKWGVSPLVHQLKYINNSLPGEDEKIKLVNHLAQIQQLYKLSQEQIIQGKIGEQRSIKPLSLIEMMEIAKILFEEENHRASLIWLKSCRSAFIRATPEERNSLPYGLGVIYNMIASTYYFLKRTDLALDATEKVLKFSPDNKVAQSNIKYYSELLMRQKNQEEAPAPVRSSFTKFDQLCRKSLKPKIRLGWCYFAGSGYLTYPKEFVSKKYNIYYLHNMIDEANAKYIADYAQQQQSDNAWNLDGTKFLGTSLVIDLYVRKITKHPPMKAVYKLQDSLKKCKLFGKRDNWGYSKGANPLLSGFSFSDHVAKLNLEGFPDKELTAVVTFITPNLGGNFVFEEIGKTVQPSFCSVLFFSVTNTELPRVCPSLQGFSWFMIQARLSPSKKLNVCTDEDE